MNTLSRSLTLVAATAVGSLVLAGCVARADQAAGDALTVTSTDDSCEISSASSASGTLNFAVTNAGSETTEFYLLASDGLRIVGEVENIAPGASRTLTVLAQPGDYYTLCKPGMIGDGVGRAAFAVTGEAVEVDVAHRGSRPRAPPPASLASRSILLCDCRYWQVVAM